MVCPSSPRAKTMLHDMHVPPRKTCQMYTSLVLLPKRILTFCYNYLSNEYIARLPVANLLRFNRNLFFHYYVSTFIFLGEVPTWFLDQHLLEMRTLLCLSLKRTKTQCYPLKICGRQLSLRYCETYPHKILPYHM